MSETTAVEVTRSAEERLAARLRQAAIGCTIHLHGPVNALAAIIDEADAGTADPRVVLDDVLARCRARAEVSTAVDRAREEKVIAVLTVFRRGLEP